MTESARYHGRPDRQVRKILEQCFNIPIAADHPLRAQLETRRSAGGDWLLHQDGRIVQAGYESAPA